MQAIKDLAEKQTRADKNKEVSKEIAFGIERKFRIRGRREEQQKSD